MIRLLETAKLREVGPEPDDVWFPDPGDYDPSLDEYYDFPDDDGPPVSSPIEPDPAPPAQVPAPEPERAPAPPESGGTTIQASKGQYDLIHHDRGATARSAIVIAGPGSGKTFSIVNRVARQMSRAVEEPLRSNQLKVVAFNTAAAEELESRIRTATGGVVPEVQTLHALAREIISVDEDGREWVRNNREAYDEQLRRARQRINQPWVASIFHRRLKEIIVDEFQDINRDMEEILLKLKGDNTSMVLVGDPDQTIYGFTGAEAGRMAKWRDEILPDDTAVYELDINRRSTANIIDLSQRLINYDDERIKLNIVPDPKAPQGEAWTIQQYNNVADEMLAVADQIADRWETDKSIAVLARDNDELNGMKTALDGKRIPWVVTGANGEVSGEGVVLSTIHRVKGKEWDHVYLTGLNREPWDYRPQHGIMGTEAERRLLYVGITRAAKSVHVSTSSQSPAQFIAELQKNPPGYRPPKRPEEVVTQPIEVPSIDDTSTIYGLNQVVLDTPDWQPGMPMELTEKKVLLPAWAKQPEDMNFSTESELSADPKRVEVRQKLVSIAERVEKALADPRLVNQDAAADLVKAFAERNPDYDAFFSPGPGSPNVVHLENVRTSDGVLTTPKHFDPLLRQVHPYTTTVSKQNIGWGAAFKFITDPATGQSPKNPLILSLRPSSRFWVGLDDAARDDIVEEYMNALHDALQKEGIQVMEVNGATIEKTLRVLATDNPDPRASTGRTWNISLAMGDEIYTKSAGMPGKRGKRDRMWTGGGIPTAAQRDPAIHPEDVALFQGDEQGRGVAAVKYAVQDDLYQTDRVTGEIIYDSDGNRVPVDFDSQERGFNGADGSGIISEKAARKMWRAQTDEPWNPLNTKVQISMAVTPRVISGRTRGMIKGLITIIPQKEWEERLKKLGHSPDVEMLISTDSMPSERSSSTIHQGKVIWHHAKDHVVSYVDDMNGLSLGPTLKVVKNPDVLVDMDRSHVAGRSLRVIDNAYETSLSLANQDALAEPSVIDPTENDKFVPGDLEYEDNLTNAERFRQLYETENVALGTNHPAASPGAMEARGNGMAPMLNKIVRKDGGANGLILPTVRAKAQPNIMLLDNPPAAGFVDVRIIERYGKDSISGKMVNGYDINLMFSPEDLQDPQHGPRHDGMDFDDAFNIRIGKTSSGELWALTTRKPTSIGGGGVYRITQETADLLMSHGLPMLDFVDDPKAAMQVHPDMADLDTKLVNPKIDDSGWIEEIIEGLTSKDPKEKLRAQQRFVSKSVGRGSIGGITLPGQLVMLSDWIDGPEDVEHWRANISGSIDVEVQTLGDTRPVKKDQDVKLIDAVIDGGYTTSAGVKKPINKSVLTYRDGYYNSLVSAARDIGVADRITAIAEERLSRRSLAFSDADVERVSAQVWEQALNAEDGKLMKHLQWHGHLKQKAFEDRFHLYAEDTPLVKELSRNKYSQIKMAEMMENIAASVSNGPWQWLTASSWEPGMAQARLNPDSIYYAHGVNNIAMEVNRDVRHVIASTQEFISQMQSHQFRSERSAMRSHGAIATKNSVHTTYMRAMANKIDEIVQDGLLRAQQVEGYQPAMYYGALKRSEAITRAGRNRNNPQRGDDDSRMFDAARSRMFKSMAGTPEEAAYFSKPKGKIDFTIRAYYTPHGGDQNLGPWSKRKAVYDADGNLITDPKKVEWEDIRNVYQERNGVPTRAAASEVRFHPAGFHTPGNANMLGPFTQIDDAVTARQMQYLSLMGYEFQWIEDVKGIGKDNHLGVWRAIQRHSYAEIPDEQLALWARLHFEEGVPLEHMPPMYTPIENWHDYVHPSGVRVEIIDGKQKLIAEKGPNRVIVTGGRDFIDADLLFQELDRLHEFHPITAIIHGGAEGADTLAGQWAADREVPVEIYPADWDADGKGAGYRRNERMLYQSKPTRVVGFPGGLDTRHMLRIAHRYEVQIMAADWDTPLPIPEGGFARKITKLDPGYMYRAEWEDLAPPSEQPSRHTMLVRQAQGDYLGNPNMPRNNIAQSQAQPQQQAQSTIRMRGPDDPAPITQPPIPPSVEPITGDEIAKQRELNRAKAAAAQEEPPKLSDRDFEVGVEDISKRPTAGKSRAFGRVRPKPSDLERNRVGGRKDSALLLDDVFEEMTALRKGIYDRRDSTFVMHQGKAYPIGAVPHYIPWEQRIRKMIWLSPTLGHYISMEDAVEAWNDLQKWQNGTRNWRMNSSLVKTRTPGEASAVLLQELYIKAEARFIKEDTFGVWEVKDFKETSFGREPIFEHSNRLTTEIRGRVRPSAMLTLPLAPGIGVSLRGRLTSYRRKQLDSILKKAMEPYEVFGGDITKLKAATPKQIEIEHARVMEARRANEFVYRILGLMEKDYHGNIASIGNVNITPGTMVAVDELLDLATDVKEIGQFTSRYLNHMDDNALEVLVRTGIRRGENAFWKALGFETEDGPLSGGTAPKRDIKNSYLGKDWDEFQNIVADIRAEWAKGNFVEAAAESVRLNNLWMVQQTKRHSRLYVTHISGADITGRSIGRILGVARANLGALKAAGFLDMNAFIDDTEIRKAWHNIRTASNAAIHSYLEQEHNDLYNRVRQAARQARSKGEAYNVRMAFLDGIIGDEKSFQSFNRTRTGVAFNIIWRVNWYTALTSGIGVTAMTRFFRKKGVKVRKRWTMSSWGIDKDYLCANNARQGWINEDRLFKSGHSVPPAHPGCRCRLQIQAPDLKIHNETLEKLTKPTFINVGKRRNYAQRNLAPRR